MQRDDEQMLKVIMFQCQPLQLLNRPNATPSALSHLMITVKSTTPTLVTKETLSNHRRFWPAAYQFTSSVRKLFFHSSTIRKLGWRRDRKVTDATRWKAQTIGRGGGGDQWLAEMWHWRILKLRMKTTASKVEWDLSQAYFSDKCSRSTLAVAAGGSDIQLLPLKDHFWN